VSKIRVQALACRDAARSVAALSTAAKRLLLREMASTLESQTDAVLEANAEDMRLAMAKGVQGAMLDRLKLDAPRVQAIADALREVAELPDPVGTVTRREIRPNGLRIERVRVPLGVIAMIYEARPNVTADAAALCLFAGNGVILRGGSEALRSNVAIAAALHSALQANDLPVAALTLIDDLSREAMVELLQLTDIVDLERHVELRGCESSRQLVPGMRAATDDDYAAEFLDLILAVRIVDDLDDALAHIRRYGSDHTEVIVTADGAAAQRFVHALRSAVVMVNASSRFSDGGQLGLGAEIGISTTRLHAYGPMGAESLTIERFVVHGEGQVRHLPA